MDELPSRKRIRPGLDEFSSRVGASFTSLSSDPAVFSSDDDPSVDNYHHTSRRRPHKRLHVGPWYQRDGPPPPPQGATGDGLATAAKPKRTFEQVDSGVWMGSDGTECGEVEAEVALLPGETDSTVVPGGRVVENVPAAPPPPSSLPLTLSTRVPEVLSAAESLAKARIEECVEAGEEEVDLSDLGLTSLSNATVAPLGEVARIPDVRPDVPFYTTDPQLKVFLSNNLLRRAPTALLSLEFLRVLSLRRNGLTALPPCVAQLPNLADLNVAQNRLRYLPMELLDLLAPPSRLERLCLHPNPFYQPEPSIGHWGGNRGGGPSKQFSELQQDEYPWPWESLRVGGDNLLWLFTSGASRLPRMRSRAEELMVASLHERGGGARGGRAAGKPFRFWARSPVQYSDSAGRVCSDFRLDDDDWSEPAAADLDADEDGVQPQVMLPAEYPRPTLLRDARQPSRSKPSQAGETATASSVTTIPAATAPPRTTTLPSRVPTLLELALRTAATKCSPAALRRLPELLPDSAPDRLRHLLGAAARRRDDGFLAPCSVCRGAEVGGRKLAAWAREEAARLRETMTTGEEEEEGVGVVAGVAGGAIDQAAARAGGIPDDGANNTTTATRTPPSSQASDPRAPTAAAGSTLGPETEGGDADASLILPLLAPPPPPGPVVVFPRTAWIEWWDVGEYRSVRHPPPPPPPPTRSVVVVDDDEADLRALTAPFAERPDHHTGSRAPPLTTRAAAAARLFCELPARPHERLVPDSAANPLPFIRHGCSWACLPPELGPLPPAEAGGRETAVGRMGRPFMEGMEEHEEEEEELCDDGSEESRRNRWWWPGTDWRVDWRRMPGEV